MSQSLRAYISLTFKCKEMKISPLIKFYAPFKILDREHKSQLFTMQSGMLIRKNVNHGVSKDFSINCVLIVTSEVDHSLLLEFNFSIVFPAGLEL